MRPAPRSARVGEAAPGAPAPSVRRNGWWLVLAAVLISSAYVVAVSWDSVSRGTALTNLLAMLAEMWPPNFGALRGLFRSTLETIAMSIAGTALAVAIAFPLSFLAAATTSPHPWLLRLTRLLFNGLRSIPELIMGILFVAAVGFGVLPGVLALGLHSAGMLGKFFAEAMEKIDPGPVEAVAAAGGSRFHLLAFGVLPQVQAHFVDYVLYRWEHNFRASTVVGMVGAGGLGFELIAALRILQYRDVFAILTLVLVLVSLVDGLGDLARRRVVQRVEGLV